MQGVQVIRNTRHTMRWMAVLTGSILVLGFGVPVAKASDAVRVATNIVFNPNWGRHALPGQRKFITRLQAQVRPVAFDVFPYNRFGEALDSELTDCVLASDPIKFENTIASASKVRFELRVFQRAGIDIRTLPNVDIGILANLPRPELPLRGEVAWHDLSSLEQAVDLLVAGRLTGIIGDSTNIRMFGRTDIVEADLPPVIVVDLSLICRDTEPLREFVSGFDLSMGVSGSGQLKPSDTHHMANNVW
ncbi:hypothetical protein HED22_11320 [Thalassospira sp. HF15]|uniref:hypothetical protein n=1 Tax=Thalassospira sp. HF15 TaxID=2722755 RepID=UPI00142F7EC2|nr:hypothetical protein [Thalassospira sp. HF15]NIY76232.1 hypothetical protein [Thalassospira sp. HF15]